VDDAPFPVEQRSMFKSRYTKLWLMLAAQLGTPVLAQPITVNTRGTGPQPVVGVTNGVPIINIAPPGTGGVSDNSFNQFNVGAGGVVLNNGISDSQTQLAGQIAANPLLDGRPASVILNRVAGSTSMLRGPLEVAGQRANVIVANPNGITCDGCGFFNVNRATLTTGRPQVGPTDSITFDVGAGGASIKINGKGLNSADRYKATLSQVDLIAKTILVNASVRADHLNVVTGINRVNYHSNHLTSRQSSDTPTRVAFDTAALGGMYANSIQLISTERGAGVNLSGHVEALAGDLQIDSKGDINIGSGGVKAHRDASILATGSTRIRGKITADNDVHILAGWVVNGLATIAAGNLVRLNVTNAIDNRRGSILGDSVEIVIGKPDVKSEAYSIHNEQGLIKANNLLNISADRIYNVDTRSKNMSRSSILGLVGNVVSIEGNPNTGWINNIAGSIVSGERLTVRIGEVTNAGGAISAHQLVDIKVGLFNNYFHRLASGDLINKANTFGRLFAGERLLMEAISLKGGGEIRSAGDLLMTLNNDVQRLQSLESTQFGTNDYVAGKISAGRDLTINSVSLRSLDTHLELTADRLMTLNVENAFVNSGIINGHAINVNAKDFVNNASGRIYGGGGGIHVTAANRAFLDGTTKSEGDVHIDSKGAVQMAGSIETERALSVTAATELNQTGRSSAAGEHGRVRLQAATIKMSGADVTGTGIALIADQLECSGSTLSTPGKLELITSSVLHTSEIGFDAMDLEIKAKRLSNKGRTLKVAGDLVADLDGLLDNTDGTISARNVVIQAEGPVLNVGGRLQAEGSLDLTVNHDLNLVGALSSGGDMSLVVAGKLHNAGQVSSGNELIVSTPDLTNTVTGELIARGAQTLNIAHGLTNEGLIDGGTTSILTYRADNKGRLYGDTLAIRAGVLINDVGPAGPAILASHGDMNLGIGSLTNREHALIYSGGDLRVGGDLDSAIKATGQADSVINSSATIEVGGHADIAAATIQNQNAHYESTVVQTSATPKVYYRPEGTADWYDGQTTWLCDLTTPGCSKDPAWLGDDSERRMLKPSATYPESHYGPSFDYVLPAERRRDRTTPVQTVVLRKDIPPGMNLEALADKYEAKPVSNDPWSKTYPADAKIWRVFGVEPPSGPVLTMPEPARSDDMFERYTDAIAERRTAAEARRAYDAHIEPVLELNRRIEAFNADFADRLVTNFAIHRVNEVVHETRTLSTDPGLLLVNGDATLNGTVINDKSQIVAGGKLTVNGPEIRNVGATGERRVEHEGTSTGTYEKKEKKRGFLSSKTRYKRRYDEPYPYRAVIAVEQIELPVAVVTGEQSGQRVSAPPAIPTHQGLSLHADAQSPYLVVTDPRLSGRGELVSSDLLFDLIHAPGGLPGSDNPLNGLDSSGVPHGKRLGDGFYEQQIVSEQIRVATGQRFLAPFRDNDEQYRALLSAGAQLAKAEGLKIGEPLSPAQVRQLTTDRAWLVTQTVTLPNGTTQQVLVPKVYFKGTVHDAVGSFDTNASPGGGTLLSGHNLDLGSSGGVENSGTMSAHDSTVVKAHDLTNRNGGRIGGRTVDLSASRDLSNLAAIIDGESVRLRAERDVLLTSTTEVDRQGDDVQNYWFSALNGVSRIDAELLDVEAVRDITLTAAQIKARDEAHLTAGRDISSTTLEQGQGQAVSYDAKNRRAVSAMSEVGTAVATEHDVAFVAGHDVSIRGATVTTGGTLTMDAGRDVHIAAGQESASAHDERAYKTSGFLSSTRTHSIQDTAWTQTQASTVTGDTVAISAGRDVNVVGSNVGAQRDLSVSAQRDVTVGSQTNTQEDFHYEQVRKSGLGADRCAGRRQNPIHFRELTPVGCLLGQPDGQRGMRDQCGALLEQQLMAERFALCLRGVPADQAVDVVAGQCGTELIAGRPNQCGGNAVFAMQNRQRVRQQLIRNVGNCANAQVCPMTRAHGVHLLAPVGQGLQHVIRAHDGQPPELGGR